ncbi:hypothetical protein [Streptomyces sp. NPDC018031]|uniref:hypothetical protein n=1 Tax=Streptomyces sp. NPDC018031 TaxID=3365033 RepID=UPI0037AFE6C5
MIENDAPRDGATRDSAWWVAPSLASGLGVPLLAWSHDLFSGRSYLDGARLTWEIAAILLAVAWLLPHRPALRDSRRNAAWVAVVLAAWPLLPLGMWIAAAG